ncbi:uncharacterized protein LOC127288621 isoform X2 [Leptopilina boulardi]|uniref:uncharacterized protein LOC127288621 isoform X2 n=1 Tax=Leptopilina boulardi TaxID=63433 RepID=UPI0021F533EF|nr:uncharacterized protein LOC127288621 isoform X2 [Leptopilina boulardi]
MATTRSLCFYLTIITILSLTDSICDFSGPPPSVLRDSNPLIILRENSSSEGTCVSSDKQVLVEVENFGIFTLKWRKPNREGLIRYHICAVDINVGICIGYESSADCPTISISLTNGYLDRLQFRVNIIDMGYSLFSSEFKFSEIKDGCSLRGDLKVFNITETSAIIQWEEPKNCNYKFVTYSVSYEAWDEYNNLYLPLNFNTTNVTVTNLRPGFIYTFTLHAFHYGHETQEISSINRIKHHLDSKIDSYLRETSNLTDHDELIEVSDVTEQSASIFWNVPVNISRHADADVFRIESNNTMEPILMKPIHHPPPKYNDHLFIDPYTIRRFSGLKAETNYTFVVAYSDDKGVILLRSREITTQKVVHIPTIIIKS